MLRKSHYKKKNLRANCTKNSSLASVYLNKQFSMCMHQFTVLCVQDTEQIYSESSLHLYFYHNTEQVYREQFAGISLLEHRVGIQRVVCSCMFTRTQSRYTQRVVFSCMFIRTQSRYTQRVVCSCMFTRTQSRYIESSLHLHA